MLACGQDVAYVVESATGFLDLEVVGNLQNRLRQHQRVTNEDRRTIDAAMSFHEGGEAPAVKHFLSHRRKRRRWRRRAAKRA